MTSSLALSTASSTSTFKSLGLDSWLCSSCQAMSITRPTAIQELAIPLLLKHRNVLFQSKTGTGKSLAFVLPLLHHLSRDAYGIFALFLVPTRELAMQLNDTIAAMSHTSSGMSSLQICCVTGGADQQSQAVELARRPHLVIATPGRLAQLIAADSKLLHVRNLHAVVFDECDRLLLTTKDEGGFMNDIDVIMRALPPSNERQTILASATLGSSTRSQSADELKANLMCVARDKLCVDDLVFVSTVHGSTGSTDSTSSSSSTDQSSLTTQLAQQPLLTNHTLTQYYILMPSHLKAVYLHYFLTKIKPYCSRSQTERSCNQVIVFAGSCQSCSELQLLISHLFQLTIDAEAKSSKKKKSRDRDDSDTTPQSGASRVVCLHSRLSQGRRLAALAAFRSHRAQVLICTDLSSRGLDLPGVEIVINYECPHDSSDYTHRVGRAARAGRTGTSLTFVTPHDVAALQRIEQHTGGGQQMLNYEHMLPEHKVCESSHLKVVLDAVALNEIRVKQFELSERSKKQGSKRSYELTRAELSSQNESRKQRS